MFSVPEGLALLATTPDGAAWLRTVPHLVARAQERWGLDVSPPFSAGSASWTMLARPHGEQEFSLVLKISYPHSEAAREADALLHWQGQGAPRLVDLEPEDWALLMEAVIPGTPLSASLWPTTAALRAGARVLAQLHAVPLPADHPFDELADVANSWQPLVLERTSTEAWSGVPLDLVARWHELLAELLATMPPPVLLHGDANPGNLLAAEEAHRTAWFAIDPKPVVGDPAFDPWPLLEQVQPDPFGAPDPVVELVQRASMVADLLGCSPWRVAAWAFVRRLESNLWLASVTPLERRAEEVDDLHRQWEEARVWDQVISRLSV